MMLFGGSIVTSGGAVSFNPESVATGYTEEFAEFTSTSWYDAQSDYSATGDGSTDDTTALQNGINALSSSHPVLYLPAGDYKISSTLNFNSKDSYAIIGEDPATTRIFWAGSASGTMLTWDGTVWSKLGRITLDGNSSAGTILNHYNTSVYSTQNSYFDLIFKNATTGILGSSNVAWAESNIWRCQFLNLSYGINLDNFNDLDHFIRWCYFYQCGVAISNVSTAGGYHAYSCNFEESSSADMSQQNTQSFAARWCHSLNSNRFIDGSANGNPCRWIIQGNTVIDTTQDDSISIGNQGPMLLVDNTIRSNSGLTDGTVVSQGSDAYSAAFAIGNTFTATNAFYCPGTEDEFDSTVVSRASIDGTAPTLPTTPVDQSRYVYEVTSSNTAAQIQTTINTAAASAYTNPIIHFSAGSYSLSSTLTVPANRAMQLIGDGWRTVLDWTGTGSGPVIQLTGPSHATVSDVYITSDGTADGILITNADQENSLVWCHHAFLAGSHINMQIDQCDYTLVEFFETDLTSASSSGDHAVQVIGGTSADAGSWLGGKTVLQSCSGTSNYNSFDVSAGARVVVRDYWYDAGSTVDEMFTVTDDSVISVEGASYAPGSANAFLGAADCGGTVLLCGYNNQSYDPQATVTGDSTGMKLLVVANSTYDTAVTDTSSPGATTGIMANLYQNNPPGGHGAGVVTDSGTQTQAHIEACMDLMRTTGVSYPTSRTTGVTDVRMYHIKVDGANIGIGISS